MLNILPHQPLTPLEVLDCCTTERYCHLYQQGENIYLQATQEPCECLECELWGENQVTNSTFDTDATGWTIDSWSWSAGQFCALGTANAKIDCTALTGYIADHWYKISLDVVVTEGCMKVYLGGTYSAEITVSGHYDLILFSGSLDTNLCVETCSDLNTICVDNVYAYPLTCVTPGEGWTPFEVTETKNTPDPNLVNGTFVSSAGWLLGPASTLGVNHVVLIDYLIQTVNISAGEKYDLGFTIADFIGSGNIKVYLGENLIDTITANGAYTYSEELETIENQQLRFESNGGAAKVSAVTLTGVQGWVKILKTVFCHDGSAAFTDPVTYAGFLPLATLIKVEIEIEGMTQGDVFVTVGSSNSDVFTSNGTYHWYLNSGTSQDLLITPSDDFNGCVRFVSVCTMISDYNVNLYTKEGVFVSNLNEFVSYKDDYVTLIVDPTQICRMTACTEASVDTFHGVTIDGVSYPLNVPDGYDALQVNIINAALNGNEFVPGIGQGEWLYTVECGSQVATSDTLATHFTGLLMADGTSYTINGLTGVAIDQVATIQAWLDTLGLGTITYAYATEGELTTVNNDNIFYVAGFYIVSPDTSNPAGFTCVNPRYCLARISGEGEFEEAAWEIGGDTGVLVVPECDRTELNDGCYYICVEDPCPETPVYDDLLVDIVFSSEEEATNQGWVGTTGIVDNGKYCSELADSFGLLLMEYEDNIWYKVIFEFTSLEAGAEITVNFFDNPDFTIFITEPGVYEFEVKGTLGTPFIIFETSLDHSFCIDNFQVYQGVPVTYCTPCFQYTQGAFDCTRLITATDEGENLGFNFDTGFKLQQRIKMNFFNPKGNEDVEDYKYSDRRRANVSAELEPIMNFGTSFLPRNSHMCLFVQRRAKNFLIDGVRYFCLPGDYDPEYGEEINSMAPVQFEVRKEKSTVYKR